MALVPPLRIVRVETPSQPCRQTAFGTVKLQHYCALQVQKHWRRYETAAAIEGRHRSLAKTRKTRYKRESTERHASIVEELRGQRKTRDAERLLKLDKCHRCHE